MSSHNTGKDARADLKPMTVEEINVLTKRARALPPTSDQTNVLIEDGEDPWVISHEGCMYYCTVDRHKRRILVSKFTRLSDMAIAPLTEVWPCHQSTPPFIEIWSPELQCIDGKFFIYFALYDGINANERMYVLEGTSGGPMGEYTFKGKIEIPTDRWAIDGSVLVTENDDKYFIWSGWDEYSNSSQNIYIAQMTNPYTLSSDRVCISRPEYDWEMHGYPYINEGPQALTRDGKLFIIYSASGSWTDDYCLGQLAYKGGGILDPNSWHKEPKPAFAKTDTIFAPGHASFIQYNNEDWIIYHAARRSKAGWARQVRAKRFTWNHDGSPDFGKPE